MPSMYVELPAASAFSFLDGASLPEALIDRAASLGYPALALLDRDGVYGAPRFHLAATRAGLQAIVGAEVTGSGGAAPAPLAARAPGARPRGARRAPPPFASAAPRSGQASAMSERAGQASRMANPRTFS